MQIAVDVQLIANEAIIVCRARQNDQIVRTANLAARSHQDLLTIDGKQWKCHCRQMPQFAIDWEIPGLLTECRMGSGSEL